MDEVEKYCPNCVKIYMCGGSRFARFLAFGSGKILAEDIGHSNDSCEGKLLNIPIRVLEPGGTSRNLTEEELLEETPESKCEALYRGQALDCTYYVEVGTEEDNKDDLLDWTNNWIRVWSIAKDTKPECKEEAIESIDAGLKVLEQLKSL